jgi:ABC-type taurine transport system ATPase subunit
MSLLAVDGVTLEYRNGKQHFIAASGVSFSVNRSDRFVILGPSGCGKSTILRAIGGYIQPVEGQILLDGKRIQSPGPDRGFRISRIRSTFTLEDRERKHHIRTHCQSEICPAGGGKPSRWVH